MDVLDSQWISENSSLTLINKKIRFVFLFQGAYVIASVHLFFSVCSILREKIVQSWCGQRWSAFPVFTVGRVCTFSGILFQSAHKVAHAIFA